MADLNNSMKEVAEDLKFDTLPPEILLKIYSYLPPADALMMSDVNKTCRGILQKDLRFKRESFNKVALKNFEGENKIISRRKKGVNYTQIQGINFILRFLRVFWHDLIVLHVNYSKCSKVWQKIVFSYIIKYRRKQLINFSIVNLTVNLDFPVESFDKVSCIRFKFCYFSTYLSNISILFPNAKNVEFLKVNDFEDRALSKIVWFTLPKLCYMKVSPSSISKNCFELMRMLNPRVFFGYHDRD